MEESLRSNNAETKPDCLLNFPVQNYPKGLSHAIV